MYCYCIAFHSSIFPLATEYSRCPSNIENSIDPSNSTHILSGGTENKSSVEHPKIISCFVRPHEGIIQPKPYTIKPTQMVSCILHISKCLCISPSHITLF